MTPGAVQHFDHIVVGAGSAGGVLAARLTEDPAVRVLLVEAGGSHETTLVSMPAGWGKLLSQPRWTWLYESEPEPWAGGRRVKQPRGKVLGGSSSVNGLLYVRGHRLDYERWVAEGAAGWGWDELLPYFVRSEDQARLSSAAHGRGGALVAADLPEVHPLTRAMIEAARQNGLAARDDFNAGENEGCGMPQVNVRHGRRSSVAVNAIEPALARPNLVLARDALATAIVLEGRTAVGLRYRQGGREIEARARGEVIVCAGAVNTPQLLMLSGLGPGASLQALGLPVVADLPGIGENLQDHCVVPMTYRCRPGVRSLNEELHGWRMLRSAWRYFALRRGVLTSPAAEFVCYYRSDPAEPHPDIQAYGLPISGDVEATVSGSRDPKAEAFAGFTLAPNHLRPHSRGHVRLRSREAAEAPAITVNYLADERDRRATIAGLRWLRRLASQPALAALIDAETRPGPAVDTDDEWLGYIADHFSSGYHLAGTCRMGRDGDPLAVVGPDLRVRGIDRLRVADASVIPSLISGNTNAISVVIGEKAADLVRGRAAPAPLQRSMANA